MKRLAAPILSPRLIAGVPAATALAATIHVPADPVLVSSMTRQSSAGGRA